MRTLAQAVRAADRAQQRWPWVAFPVAVVRKFGDDQAGSLAALIAYYAFAALLPLLLLFVTVLGLVLRSNPALQQRMLHSALVEFPVIGDQLRLEGLHGSWWVLVVSIMISLWGARGVAAASQNALNGVWNVPYAQRPGFWPGLLRSVGLLVTMGVTVLITGFLSGVGGTGLLAPLVRAGALLASTALNVALFALAFRLATAPQVATRCLILGAVLSALLWQILLAVGGLLLTHQVRHAQSLYGAFGVVLGLLGWLQLQAQLTLYAAEVDVVRTRGLWPRSATGPPLTRADRRAYVDYAQTTRRLPLEQQEVGVRFRDGARGPIGPEPDEPVEPSPSAEVGNDD